MTSTIEDIQNLQQPRRTGTWIGVVENKTDPNGNGRVQVRIHQLHGGRDNVPTTALPWAFVEQKGGGVHDTGSAWIPEVGAWVTLDFIQGHQDLPIVRGSINGLPDAFQEVLTVDGKTDPLADVDVSQQWNAPRGSELPVDIYQDNAPGDKTPTRQVFAKSVRGHTIVCEDGDGKEFIKIIDRAGQMIEMSCPTAGITNAQNWEQRGGRDAGRGTQLLQDAMLNGHAHIRLVDLSGQEVVLDSTKGNEKILIKNRDKTGQAQQTIEMSAKRGAEFIAITDSKGNILKFEPNSPTNKLAALGQPPRRQKQRLVGSTSLYEGTQLLRQRGGKTEDPPFHLPVHDSGLRGLEFATQCP